MANNKTATAETSLDIYVHCPYCDNFQDATEGLREHLEEDLRASGISIDIKCDDEECGKVFTVTEITY